MGRAAALVLAVAGVLALGPRAYATQDAPTPSATYTTAVDGRALPAASMSGSWQVTRPGRAATLKATGVSVIGAETTVHTTWTSALYRGIGLKFACGGDYSTIAPGSVKNGIAIRIQYRQRHGRWQEFGGGRMDYSSQPLDAGGQGVGSAVEFLHPVTLQWRVTVTATYDDLSQQTFREAVKAF